MITRIVDWIAGREPVASATGIAGVITAILGVVAALGVDLSPELIAAIGTLAAAIAGWLARKAVTPVASPADRQLQRLMAQGPPPPPAPGDSADDGGVPLATIILIGLAVVLMIGLATCTDALFEDEDEKNDLGLPALVLDHERHRCMDHDYCGGGYDDWGGGSDGNTGYDGEGGRSGDMEQGDGSCRNFCNWTIPGDMMPGRGDGERDRR